MHLSNWGSISRSVGFICALAVAVAMTAGPARAQTSETYKCWRPDDGARLACRVGGSYLRSYEDETAVPTRLYPAVGRDPDGECWYQQSVFTEWRFLSRSGDLALMGFAASALAAPVPIGWARSCDREPDPIDPDILEVWRILREHGLASPDPVLNPAVGITGLATYVAAQPPAPERFSVVGRIGVVDLELVVVAVVIDWGDGSETEVDRSGLDGLVGWPYGSVRHVYEMRDEYSAEVAFHWRVRWRVNSGRWQPLLVPPTSASIVYPVDELVGRRTA